MKRGCLLALWLLAPLQGAQAQSVPSELSPALGFLQALLVLAFVIALVFATGWVMRRIMPQSGGRGGLRVISSIAVGTRERVVVVRCQDQILTLGVAPGRVNLLQASPAGAEAAAADTEAPAAPRFLDRLRQLTRNETAH